MHHFDMPTSAKGPMALMLGDDTEVKPAVYQEGDDPHVQHYRVQVLQLRCQGTALSCEISSLDTKYGTSQVRLATEIISITFM
jgi:hypothetical protein